MTTRARHGYWTWACLTWLLLWMAALPAVAAQPPLPLLWKVSQGQGDAAVYLLGSFHLLQPGDYPSAPEVQDAFRQSDRIAFELAPAEMEPATLGAAMLQAATRRDGSRLQDDLDAATWRQLQDFARAQGLDLARMSGFKTWFVGLSVGMASMTRQGLDPDLGLDRHFMQQAGSAGKPVSGLESAASQIALLDGMSLLEQRQLLADALEQARPDSGQARELHDAWRRGDAELLRKLTVEQMRAEYPQLYRRMNVDRNSAWLLQLQRWLQPGQGRTLVVVGAMHLLGADGLVERLRAKGYRVARVCSGCAGQPPQPPAGAM
ncbi:TraB/GumN family protein [Stenotrophomonas sp. MMGLT7]|uniref:TraB/GumN family protein n=1 Tax=Stenotrophomonas sp. MMGLT7 TaxID=2901227 RepID=UPI001E40F5CC|nr:TraB/GumN family protein [Stenotrophomonas sp. MMGLT7]MCD7098721.1 TraB/GumN family protein [Stenotrophomonas sp. MMGLT7]